DRQHHNTQTAAEGGALNPDPIWIEVSAAVTVNVDALSNDPYELHPINDTLSIAIGLRRQLRRRQSGRTFVRRDCAIAVLIDPASARRKGDCLTRLQLDGQRPERPTTSADRIDPDRRNSML